MGRPFVRFRFVGLIRVFIPGVLLLALLAATMRLAGASPLTQPQSDDDPQVYPTDMPAVGVAVLQDSLDANGHWTQVVQLTIKSGGTLADASFLAYGDANHVDALFAAARRKNPRLYAPAMMPVGQQIDLTIDPSTTYVLATVLHTSNTLVRRFTNGVVSTEYSQPSGSLGRVLQFPSRRPTDTFVYLTAPGPVKVRPGGKLVDLVYAKDQPFGDLVRQIYGFTNYATAADLTKQTGWDPTHWPPPAGTTKRVIIGEPASYQAAPPDVAPIPNADPVGRARQTALIAARRKAGIHPIRLETFGQVYHVAVDDPALTASDVSTLIYGSPTYRSQVAAAAGFITPGPNNRPSPSFDPHLFGRAFDVAVDYIDERFVVRTFATAPGLVETDLIDGARITAYPPGASGPLQTVEYPTGYKRITYRPPKALLTLAQGLALFHVADDLTLSPSAADTATRQYEAQVIWRWAPDFPRSSGDTADTLQLVDDPKGVYVSALVAPPGPHTAVQRAIDFLRLQNPIVATVGLVGAGSLLVVIVGILQRSRAQARRVRW